MFHPVIILKDLAVGLADTALCKGENLGRPVFMC